MIEIKGKYNVAKVMIDEIDSATKEQIQGFVNNPSFSDSYIAIMPDCHKGAGSCVGFTMQMNDRIIPDVVGVDIGCGMLSCKFDVEDFDIPSLDAFIKEKIPSGFGIRDTVCGLDFYMETAKKIGMDVGRASKSLGTLGGGNHFIEAGYGADGKLWVTIHSGSRNFGLQIANYHGKKAKELCRKWGAETGGIPFLLVDSPEGKEYIVDQQIGVLYAQKNREMMMDEIVLGFFKEVPVECIESVHNFIDDTGMIRKGATSVHLGQKVIIPFNMRDGLAICVGKGNEKYNYSAPHGAGRTSSTKAKEFLDVNEFKADMEKSGVYTTTACAATLDEAPGAYKDMSIILENIKDTVDVIEMIKPVYNFKAGGE